MKRIEDFESLDDFGYTIKNDSHTTNYVKCDKYFTGKAIPKYNIVPVEVDGSPGRFRNLNQILSGGTITLDISVATGGTQAEIPIDYSNVNNLAYFGSVYSVIADAINNIKKNYPNGFLIVAGDTGATNTFTFSHNQSYTYGNQFSSNAAYSGFGLYAINGSNSIVYTGSVVQASGGTGSTILYLDSIAPTGVGYTYAVFPKVNTRNAFYSTISKYELDLLVPTYSRTNYWPRDSIVSENIVLEGSSYETFKNTELEAGISADTNTTNIAWRKLYPDGQKVLDSNTQIAQKMIYTFARSFDEIKKYQDHIAYLHSIGYGVDDHISRDLIIRLANHWNWSLESYIDSNDHGKYVYSTYDDYVTGWTLQKLSEQDVNFESWRRILANLVYLYKKKGTREGLKYLLNIYSIPEDLLRLDEIIKVTTTDNTTFEIPNLNISGIIPLSGNNYYVDGTTGALSALAYTQVHNTKKLAISISPYHSIETSFYNFGWAEHPAVINVNGQETILSSTTQITRDEWESRLYNSLLRSDGGARYDSHYPLLKNEGSVYTNNASDPKSVEGLLPYVKFLSNSWSTHLSKLVPAGSKIVSRGIVYENPVWATQKHQWNKSELTAKALPFNSGHTFTPITLSQQYVSKNTASTTLYTATSTYTPRKITTITPIQNPIATKPVNKFDSIAPIIFDSSYTTRKQDSIEVLTKIASYRGRYYHAIDPLHMSGGILSALSRSQTIYPSESGYVTTYSSPILVPTSANTGTLTYVDYSTGSVIAVNENIISLPFSANNISISGYTSLNFELFKRQIKTLDDNILYAVTKIHRETSKYGIYTVSTVKKLYAGATLEVDSPYSGKINSVVAVTYVNSGNSIIRTTPPFGAYNIPGINNLQSDWEKFLNTAIVLYLKQLYDTMGVTLTQFLDMFILMRNKLPSLEARGTYEYSSEYQFLMQNFNMDIIALLEKVWYEFDLSTLDSCVILLQFMVTNHTRFTLDTNPTTLINELVLSQTKLKFRRQIQYFDWKNPDQSLTYTNWGSTSGETGNWIFPIVHSDLTNRGENTSSMSGNIKLGGLNELNSNILIDLEEYFYRYKIRTHTPISLDDVISGLDTISGVSIFESNHDVSVINDIPYYGRYFMYMISPKEPVLNAYPENSTATTTDSASVTIKWKGVSDSSRLELQFWNNGQADNATQPSYSTITSSNWNTATTVNVPARKNVTDDYLYTIQTTLEPDTYYWWRVKNYRNKINMFGHNLEAFAASQPYAFKTGSFKDSGERAGEIDSTPTPPTGTTKISTI